MGEPTVNGEKPSSQFLHELATIPLISDSITYLKSNPYGQKSLQLADKSYSTYAKPVLPLLSKPFHYVAPYVAKADSLSSEGLKRVEDRFPIVKEDTENIKGTLKNYVDKPFKVVQEGKQHLLQVYSTEYKNCGGGEGYVSVGKAVLITGIIITSESLEWLKGFIMKAEKETQKGVGKVAKKIHSEKVA